MSQSTGEIINYLLFEPFNLNDEKKVLSNT